MSKIIQYDTEARRRLKDGMNALARAVVVTPGPKGRTVIFEKTVGDQRRP
jgi:chaperonin GroEL